MIAKIARIGSVAGQDALRRQDMLAMTPSERVVLLIELRDHQFGPVSRPIRGSGAVRYRALRIAGKH